MKLQLFILSVLLLNAFAHPVPDEEVSPVKAALPAEAKAELTQTLAEKPLAEAKTQILAAEEIKPEKKLPEKLALPEIAPDAEIAQPLPEKKEEKLAIDKQTRAEDKVSGDVKALPVVETPVAGIEAEKQIVDEVKPAVEEAQPVGKSADIAAEAPAAEVLVSEQKKDELSAAETAPAVKSEIALPAPEEVLAVASTAAIAEEKKEEQPARQERGTEEQVKQAVAEEAPVKAAVDAPLTPAVPEAEPEIKSLKPAEEQPEAPKAEEALLPAASTELKLAAAEKPAEPAPAAGDIPTPQAALDSIPKALPVEAEKPEAPAAPAAAEAKKIEEPAAAKPAEALPEAPIAAAAIAAPESAEPLKKLEKPEEKKSEESKESKESKESESDSKESEESKEDKSN